MFAMQGHSTMSCTTACCTDPTPGGLNAWQHISGGTCHGLASASPRRRHLVLTGHPKVWRLLRIGGWLCAGVRTAQGPLAQQAPPAGAQLRGSEGMLGPSLDASMRSAMGDHHGFLHILVQSLWHVWRFRQALLSVQVPPSPKAPHGADSQPESILVGTACHLQRCYSLPIRNTPFRIKIQ